MTTGRCLRCGAVGVVEADHPDGRARGVPLYPNVVGLLCGPCHLTKGRMDRAARVEGGPVTLRRVLGRRAAWCSFFSSGGPEVTLPAHVLEEFGHVLASIARQIPPDLPFRVDV